MAERPLQLDKFLPFRLSVTSNLVSDTIARTYRSLFGLSIPEWRLIAVVAEGGGLSQGAVGGRTRMDKVTVSRAAIALVDRGLLAREGKPGDRRSHVLALTPAGAELYAAVVPKALDLERRIFARFSAAELEGFVGMLRRIDEVTLGLGEEG